MSFGQDESTALNLNDPRNKITLFTFAYSSDNDENDQEDETDEVTNEETQEVTDDQAGKITVKVGDKITDKWSDNENDEEDDDVIKTLFTKTDLRRVWSKMFDHLSKLSEGEVCKPMAQIKKEFFRKEVQSLNLK